MLILDHAKRIITNEMINCQEVYIKGALVYIRNCFMRNGGIRSFELDRDDGHINHAATAANVKRISGAAVETSTGMDLSPLW